MKQIIKYVLSFILGICLITPALSTPPKLESFAATYDTLHLEAMYKAVATTPSAPTNWSIAGFGTYNFKTKHFEGNAVVLDKLTDFTHVLGKDWSIEFDAFTGVNTDGKGVSGFALGKTWKAADQINLFAGGAVAITPGDPIKFGIVLGAQYKF